ncbi:helix-turn-helix domain-containing protein [Desulfitobacterium metallireducens]|uniref:DNA-binding protein n=1 Tax=Desulfitobacterium metallireducens DSM 15288 TaxID=871968 RepID=W0E892_9FIRM|nr:helix-turn-helix transcriptional regulator [Desulfitobacterium metallireducens]AHF07085.1 DNA-binding protein [Desulfitobacterium metallireducens DSM 15288]
MSLSKQISEHKEALQEIGRYISDYRGRRKLSLQHMGARVGVNPSYLRDVERGEKIPDDEFIRNLSENCGLDENYIYDCMGKAPLVAREELEHHSILQETLKEIGMSGFSEQIKEEIYRKFYFMAKMALVNIK